MHKIRRAMIRPGREPLQERVEVDVGEGVQGVIELDATLRGGCPERPVDGVSCAISASLT